mmetsp:Transcript_64295/g.119487  ORF Transcript_64295/g.119487 Transcript_64295/m.119487 type:complete len:370 (-) Transcript_64295:45-1154(-)
MVLSVQAARAVLGLHAAPTWEQVRSAYRSALLEAHPDKGGDPERFRQVRRAWELLAYRRKNPVAHHVPGRAGSGGKHGSKGARHTSSPKKRCAMTVVRKPVRKPAVRKDGSRLQTVHEDVEAPPGSAHKKNDATIGPQEMWKRTMTAEQWLPADKSNGDVPKFSTSSTASATPCPMQSSPMRASAELRKVLVKYQGLTGEARKEYVRVLPKEMKRELARLVKTQHVGFVQNLVRPRRTVSPPRSDVSDASSGHGSSESKRPSTAQGAPQQPVEPSWQTISPELLQRAGGAEASPLKRLASSQQADLFKDMAGLASFLRARPVEARREAIAGLPPATRRKLEQHMVALAKSKSAPPPSGPVAPSQPAPEA